MSNGRQTITINLPEKLLSQLQQAARLSHQPIEAIVEQSLAQSLPPLLNDIPTEYQADVFPLLRMTDAELQEETRQSFDPEQWAVYEALLEKKKNEPLSPGDQAQLDTLRRQADILTFRKAYAAVLLKRRGYAVLAPKQLPTAR